MEKYWGNGTITNEGYRYVRVGGGRQQLEHRLVWEENYGPIPDDKEIHHINEDKLDNRIENLELLDRLTHKRIHSGCFLHDGVEFKPCCKCKEAKPIDQYYKKGIWISSWCKSCQKAYQDQWYLEYKKQRESQKIKDNRTKLTESQVQEIINRPNDSQRKLGKEYGVDPSTISNIRTRKTWRR